MGLRLLRRRSARGLQGQTGQDRRGGVRLLWQSDLRVHLQGQTGQDRRGGGARSPSVPPQPPRVRGSRRCSSQSARATPTRLMPTWLYAKSSEGVNVNLFVGSTVTVENVAGTDVEMVQATNYPWDGRVAITVNPQTFDVFVNGELATCEPAKVLPLAQRYMLR